MGSLYLYLFYVPEDPNHTTTTTLCFMARLMLQADVGTLWLNAQQIDLVFYAGIITDDCYFVLAGAHIRP